MSLKTDNYRKQLDIWKEHIKQDNNKIVINMSKIKDKTIAISSKNEIELKGKGDWNFLNKADTDTMININPSKEKKEFTITKMNDIEIEQEPEEIIFNDDYNVVPDTVTRGVRVAIEKIPKQLEEESVSEDIDVLKNIKKRNDNKYEKYQEMIKSTVNVQKSNQRVVIRDVSKQKHRQAEKEFLLKVQKENEYLRKGILPRDCYIECTKDHIYKNVININVNKKNNINERVDFASGAEIYNNNENLNNVQINNENNVQMSNTANLSNSNNKVIIYQTKENTSSYVTFNNEKTVNGNQIYQKTKEIYKNTEMVNSPIKNVIKEQIAQSADGAMENKQIIENNQQVIYRPVIVTQNEQAMADVAVNNNNEHVNSESRKNFNSEELKSEEIAHSSYGASYNAKYVVINNNQNEGFATMEMHNVNYQTGGNNLNKEEEHEDVNNYNEEQNQDQEEGNANVDSDNANEAMENKKYLNEINNEEQNDNDDNYQPRDSGKNE